MKRCMVLLVGCFIVLAGLAVSAAPAAAPESSEPMINPLVNKRFEYKYGPDIYIVKYDTDHVFNWRGTAGVDKGKSENVAYRWQKLSSGVYYICWVETSGETVSQVLDFNNKKITCYWIMGKKITPVTGTIRILGN